MTELEKKCVDAGLKMTDQRRAILRVLEDSDDHPTVETVYNRAGAIDSSVSIATVYRTLGLLDELGLVLKHDFGNSSSARFEVHLDDDHHHHHHLVDTESGDVLEFESEELEALVHKICDEMGYEMVDHVFEIYGHKKKVKKSA